MGRGNLHIGNYRARWVCNRPNDGGVLRGGAERQTSEQHKKNEEIAKIGQLICMQIWNLHSCTPSRRNLREKREHEDNNAILLRTHILSTPLQNRERTRTPKALRDVMHLYVWWLFRAKRESLSSRNNDILKKNIDILKLEEGKAGSPMCLEPQTGTYFIICKEGSPPHTS